MRVNGRVSIELVMASKRIGAAGLALLKGDEGFRPEVYDDATGEAPGVILVGKLTIGYGHTLGVKPGMKVDEAQATAYLMADVGRVEDAVNASVKVEINQNQFDALCVFAFNVGIGAFESSTLLRMLNEGKYGNAHDQFSRWNKVGANVVPGLVKRRRDEALLFETVTNS